MSGHDLLQPEQLGNYSGCETRSPLSSSIRPVLDLVVHLDLFVGQRDVASGVDFFGQIEAVFFEHPKRKRVDAMWSVRLDS